MTRQLATTATLALVIVAAVVWTAPLALAQTPNIGWKTAGGGAWSIATNWKEDSSNTERVPGVGDHVVIGGTTSNGWVNNAGIVTLEGSPTVGSLSIGGGSTLSGSAFGTLTSTGQLVIHGSGSKFTIGFGNLVAGELSVESGGELNSSGNVTAGSATFSGGTGKVGTQTFSVTNWLTLQSGGTLDLNASSSDPAVTAGGLRIDGAGSGLVRGGTARNFVAGNLHVSNGGTVAFRNGDSVTNSILVENSTLNIDNDVFSGSSVTALDNGTINLSQSLNGDVVITNDSTLNHSAGNLTGTLHVNNSTYSQSGSATLNVNSLTLSGGSTLALQASQTVGTLNVSGDDSAATIDVGRTLANLAISDFALVSFTQLPDGTTGFTVTDSLTIDGTGMLELYFSEAAAAEGDLDWAMRLEGDYAAQLTGYLATDRIVFDGADAVAVFYDTVTNFTYLHSATAVPEPGSVALLLAGTGWVLARRRQRAKQAAAPLAE